ncbi:PilZ domain-containing protein [Thiomicrorhabdus sp.]|uniref:PilZ domain-containing protein n=1 Tax=Thiomicrorhabdus sp. TaxID=2039724 RepID=UPI0029C95462|nr:PilZ domain-containing protein [Thiomicrorhabdus sp.]
MVDTLTVSASGRRRHPRVSIKGIRLFYSEREFSIKNISSGGMAFFSSEEHVFDVGQEIDFDLNSELLDGFFSSMPLKARVVNTAGDLVMVEFTDFNPNGKKLLDRLIENYLTGELEENQKLLTSVMGFRDVESDQKRNRQRNYLSFAMSSLMVVVAVYLVWHLISVIRPDYSMVTKEVTELRSPVEGKVNFSDLQEGQALQAGQGMFRFQNKEVERDRRALMTQIRVLETQVDLKEKQLNDAQAILSNHIKTLKTNETNALAYLQYLRDQIKNARTTYEAYRDLKGATSKIDYLSSVNDYLALQVEYEQANNVLANIQSDIRNAKNGFYSKNGIFEESFASPKKIKRELEQIAVTLNEQKSALKDMDEAVYINSLHSGTLDKILVESGNGVTNGEVLALVSTPKSKKFIVSVIDAQKAERISEASKVTVKVNQKEIPAKIAKLKHSYKQLFFTDQGGIIYGLDSLRTPGKSFVFIEVDAQALAEFEIGTPLEVRIDSRIQDWLI